MNQLELLTQQNKSDSYLILTNAYPNPTSLYQNAFIHRRVKAYQKHNIDIKIFILSPTQTEKYEYVYDDVFVTRGNVHVLMWFLSEKKYTKILIHFVKKNMIEAIKTCTPNTPLIIWIHGYEAETWHRRWFNYLEDTNALKTMISRVDYYKRQMEFINYLYQTKELNLTFIHVSKWFKESIAECDARIPTQNSHIIPNFIDSSVFKYTVKSSEHRFRILSIRPYASRKYANDLSVKTVLELAKRPYFKHLQFSFWGDGEFFDSITKPLEKFRNVQINKGFLTQDEIARTHKEHGIFLCPTRLDSQGVSMCEAMSSGLVPISTNVSAIPEFIEHNRNGLLSEPENPVHMANLIERLYYDQDLFLKLSKNATLDIKAKCDEEIVIKKELSLIKQEKSIPVEQQLVFDHDYWFKRYCEMENQLLQILKMSLNASEETEVENHINITTLQKKLRYFRNFKHSIDVTYLGKLAKLYIQIKKQLRLQLKRLPILSQKLVFTIFRK